MSCGTLFFFCFALVFSFIAVKWPKIAKRPNKQPKETSVYKKFVRFTKDSKMKTLSVPLSVHAGLVHADMNIFLLLFLFRIAFTIRAVTSLKMELELEPA